MESSDFIIMPDIASVGDAFRALADAKANVNWYIVVKSVDHYGGIQAGRLAQSIIGRGTQAALQVALRELDIPAVHMVSRPSGNLDQVRQLTLVLENDRPVAVAYEPMRGSFTDMMNAKSAFDQLASTVATSVTPTTDFIAMPAAATVRDVFNVLLDVKGNINWYVIVCYPDHYGAIQAGRLAQAVIGRGAQAALKMPLSEVDIPAINAMTSGEASTPDRIRQLTLVLENDLPVLVYQTYRLDLNSTQDAFERLTVEARTRSVPKAQPSDTTAGPPSPTPGKTDARARYVNTWFTDRVGGEAFILERTLARRRRYFIQLHIGPLLRESIVVAPRPIDPDLPPIPDEGLLLRIKLFSRDFEIEQDTAELRLSKTGATERLHLAVTPRDMTRDARLRIGIYYQNNLTQSILLHARVDEQEMKLGRGDRANWAEIEYSLSEDWADITQLQERRVNVFVNDSPDGTHMVGVVGTSTEGSLDIGRDKMKEAVTEFRTKLLGIVMDDKGYRFSADNAGTREQFVNDLKTLAYVGNALFRCVFYREETIDFTRELREALASTPSSIIQIARLSSDFVFPWAGIYDRRVMIDREKNQVCLEPLKFKTPEEGLASCANCSHGDDPNVICLAGFWGFRHIVEQPLSVIKKDGKPTSVVGEIKAGGKPRATVNVYVGEDFKLRPAHQAWIGEQVKQKNGETIVADELKEVQEGLKQAQQLCYFYCHGGSTPDGKKPWLTVGKGDQLVPSNLSGLGLENYWRFNNVRPLVFINGCHTVEFTPEALSNFLPEFGTAGASGIIGTEISIYEPLAVEFGEGLIQAFLNGESIGKAVQKLRWQLLLKRNVLGLVYTLYCYADLKLVA
jgi:hypothetical protein